MTRSTLVSLFFILPGALHVPGAAAQPDPSGYLFIIGGGRRPPEMMKKFVDLAGGSERSNIVVLPMASAEPESTGMRQAAELLELGAKSARSLVLTRDQALGADGFQKLHGVTGVFYSGGDQSRLMKVLLGTPVHARLLEMYREGVVMGGTSAGAAVMSRIMITGDETLNKDSTESFVFVKKGNVVTSEGFGFLEDVIVDQHFIRRKRLNRLISLVLEYPSHLGVGIDEATAIVVKPGGTFDVIGQGAVMIFDASQASHVSADTRANLSAANVVFHLLTGGQSFDLRKRVRIR